MRAASSPRSSTSTRGSPRPRENLPLRAWGQGWFRAGAGAGGGRPSAGRARRGGGDGRLHRARGGRGERARRAGGRLAVRGRDERLGSRAFGGGRGGAWGWG